MIANVVGLIATIVMLCSSMATRRDRGGCSPPMILATGIRTQGPGVGLYMCQPPPIGGDSDVLTGTTTSVQPPGFVIDQIYCTGGSVPIVVDYQTVGCSHSRAAL